MKALSRKGKATLPGKVNVALSLEQRQLQRAKATMPSGTVQSLPTTELEGLALAYERGMPPMLTTFARSAILKGIAAELAERTAEKVELRKGNR